MTTNCERCGRDLPPSRRARRFCSDSCRKAASRAASVPVVPVEGPVSAAVATALAECSFGAADNARAALAQALARMVDGGSVPAAAQLRVVLADLDDIVDPDYLELLAAVRTPGYGGAPRGGNGAG